MFNKKLAFKFSICALVFAFGSATVFCADTNQAGKNIWDKIVEIGQWFILFRGGYDIVCSAMKRDKKGIIESIFITVLSCATLLALPSILNYVKSLIR